MVKATKVVSSVEFVNHPITGEGWIPRIRFEIRQMTKDDGFDDFLMSVKLRGREGGCEEEALAEIRRMKTVVESLNIFGGTKNEET